MNRRQTHQRQAILEAIQGKGHHMSAEEVLSRVQQNDPGIGLATVYRNLTLLCDMGLIQKVTEEGASFYDGNPEPHYHLHCQKCGRYLDMDLPYQKTLGRKAAEAAGARIFGHTVTFEGICQDCLAKEKEEKKSWN